MPPNAPFPCDSQAHKKHSQFSIWFRKAKKTIGTNSGWGGGASGLKSSIWLVFHIAVRKVFFQFSSAASPSPARGTLHSYDAQATHATLFPAGDLKFRAKEDYTVGVWAGHLCRITVLGRRVPVPYVPQASVELYPPYKNTQLSRDRMERRVPPHITVLPLWRERQLTPTQHSSRSDE